MTMSYYQSQETKRVKQELSACINKIVRCRTRQLLGMQNGKGIAEKKQIKKYQKRMEHLRGEQNEWKSNERRTW